MSCKTFIKRLTGRIYKILPIKERECAGETLYLDKHLSSVIREIRGACITFPELNDNPDFISVANIVEYLGNSHFTLTECRADIMRACRLLNKIEARIGGDDHGC